MAFTIIRQQILQGQTASQPSAVAGTTLTIGRGTGNALVLDDLQIALHHAEITLVDGRYVIKALDPNAPIFAGSRAVSVESLRDGQVLHIGSYALQIHGPDGQGDLRVEVTPRSGEDGPDGATAVAFVARHRLWTGRWTKTRFTLLGFGLFIVLPALAVYLGQRPLGQQTWRTATLLAPGDVTQAHRFIGHECAKCHATTWGVPTTEACTACHARPLHHASQTHTPACASCHREHRGDHKPLTSMGDQFCTDCHANLQTDTGKPPQFVTHIRALTEGHPEFAVTLRRPKGEPPQRVRLGEKTLSDPTALQLNHALHLTPERMTRQGFKALTCNNCHKADQQGAYMEPITYTEHCSQCHPLEFDNRFPGQAVPHGKQPEAIHTFLKQNFTQRCLERSVELPASPSEGGETPSPRRLPGQATATPREPQAATAATVVQCSAEGVREAERRLYTGGAQSVCGLCHTVQAPAGADGLPTVAVPAVPVRWLVHSTFNHLAHARATKPLATDGKNACEICHSPALAAHASTRTNDVLLPTIQVCTQCHSATGGASAQCVTCHQYHDAENRHR